MIPHILIRVVLCLFFRSFQEQQDLFTVIAAVLHLGNVLFDLDESDAAMVTDPNGAVKMAAVSVWPCLKFTSLAFSMRTCFVCQDCLHKRGQAIEVTGWLNW